MGFIASSGVQQTQHRPTFGGNDKASVSSVDGTFDMSRTSGYIGIEPNGQGINVPAFVQVSASSITASGTITGGNGTTINVRPFQDLEFSWDFGDPAGTETFVSPVTGRTVNANTEQKGPEAAYAYRNVGTYVITLTVRYKDAAGTIRLQTFTRTFVADSMANISGFTRHWYVDGAAGNDSTGSGTFAAPYQTLTKVMTAGFIQAKSCLWLKAGSVWTEQGTLTNTGGKGTSVNFRIGVYGSGAKPIIERTTAATNGNPILYTNGAGGLGNTLSVDDVVFSNIDCRLSGTHTGSAIIGVINNDTYNPVAVIRNVYFDNVDASATIDLSSGMTTSSTVIQGGATGRFAGTGPGGYGFGLWKCSSTVPTTFPTHWGTGWLGSGLWCFSVGSSYTGAGGGYGSGTGDTIHDHHVYIHSNQHALLRWNSFNAGPNRNYCVNLEVDPTITAADTDYCQVTGTISGSSGAGPSTATLNITPSTGIKGPGVPTIGQFVVYMGGTSGTIAGQITAGGGNTWTISSNQALADVASSTTFVLAPAHGACQGTISGASGTTGTFNVTAGTLTGSLSVGDQLTLGGNTASGTWKGVITAVVSAGSTYTIFAEAGVANNAVSSLYYAWSGQVFPQVVNYFLISDNYLSGSENGHSGNTSNNNSDTARVDDFVFQQNLIQGLGGTGDNTSGGSCCFGYCNRSYTSRDNFWMNNGNSKSAGFFYMTAAAGGGTMVSSSYWAVYRNKLYIPSTEGVFAGGVNFNTTALTSTLPLQFYGNIIQDDRNAVTNMVQVKFTGSNNANSIIDNNTYYSLGTGGLATDTAWSNTSTGQTFANWKISQTPNIDQNSTINTSAGWTVPPTSFKDMGGFI